MSRNIISLEFILTRVDNEIFVALDGRLLEIADFGFTAENFKNFGDHIQLLANKILNNKDENKT